MAVAKPDGETFHPTLILVGTRLGIDKINQVYWEALTATLQMPQSVGIAGYVFSPHYALRLHALQNLMILTVADRRHHTILSVPNEPAIVTSQVLISSISTRTLHGLRCHSTSKSTSTREMISTRAILDGCADCMYARWTPAC